MLVPAVPFPGTLVPFTWIVQVPLAGEVPLTCSTLFVLSAVPAVSSTLFGVYFVVPSGAVTTRSRSLTSFFPAAEVAQGSVHTRVTTSGLAL